MVSLQESWEMVTTFIPFYRPEKAALEKLRDSQGFIAHSVEEFLWKSLNAKSKAVSITLWEHRLELKLRNLQKERIWK